MDTLSDECFFAYSFDDRLRQSPASLSVIVENCLFSLRMQLSGFVICFVCYSWIAHATLKGPSVVKEIIIGITLGLAAGGVWKMHHWNEQRKTRTFYDLLEKGEITVVAEEQ
ncbi:Cytochrome c oxidase subunit 5C-2 [Glycine soja]|uniref:Cytochrome c oxidase subunit 5C-2 n=1 Tax=Glycine soja TaxID=3848 RepID=A0A445IGI0_GLYSO|nr:Cytochrome c oxidase subunit 5C-2 [Glycine soja]